MDAADVVVITGASAGVGRAAALAFARAGFRSLALVARDEAGLDAAAAEVTAAGATAHTFVADVADAAAVERIAAEIERDIGPIGVWVNNAMATIFAPVELIGADEFARVTEVTYLGAVYGTMSALRRMRARNRGTIVQVGSALAYRAIPLQSAYCGAKHALRGFTDALRCELRHDGSAVRLTMVQLPGLNTPQFDWARNRFRRHPQPVGTVYQPEVAARAIVWAARHAPRELQVGWVSSMTIAANKCWPALMDRILARRAYEQQFSAEPIAAGRPDNLFGPVPSLARTRGSFDARAHRHSAQLWLATRGHGVLLAGLAVALLAAWQGWRRK
ncbi:MAG: SDR family oxidoreductase [Pseudomonadota bacterium]